MGTAHDHRRYAEECVAMAQRSDDESDKALWLTLAQSWVRLAEHVAQGPLEPPDKGVEIAEAGLAGGD
jgi:hypothetical protein